MTITVYTRESLWPEEEDAACRALGIPVVFSVREFRFFVYGNEVLAGGFYWASVVDDLEDAGTEIPSVDEVPRDWLQSIVEKTVACPFRVIDVARTATGGWVVVELNDGQMSGLSCVPPAGLYQAMAAAMTPRVENPPRVWDEP